jgi:hypothetical protein
MLQRIMLQRIMLPSLPGPWGCAATVRASPAPYFTESSMETRAFMGHIEGLACR